MQSTTWVEVSSGALERNFRAVAAHAGVPVCAVVKANGYGHGLVIAARALVAAGAAMLGVTRIEEARALRSAGIDAPVLIMMPVPDPVEAVQLGCAITVGSADEIGAVPTDARVHLKLDTGMGRLGVTGDPVEAARALARRAHLDAVWTHFADGAGETGPMQLALFSSAVARIRADGILVSAHASNSAALLSLPGARFDMVRIGTLLYGQNPPGARAPWMLHETFAWYARVAAVRTLPAGASAGYGSEWHATKDTRVATIPIGYADGFLVEPVARTPSLRQTAARASRGLRKGGDRLVYFGDRAAPVLGRVAMQSILVEAPADVVPGDVARIPARRLMVSSMIERVLR